jgi:ferredoxin
MPEAMPEYGRHVWLEGRTIHVTAWVKDPKIRALTHTSSSFPGRFTTSIDVQRDVIGAKHRFDAHGRVEAILFTDQEVMDNWQWMAHFITTKCTACTICERVCPLTRSRAASASHRPGSLHRCSVCGVYCPFDDRRQPQVVVPKIQPKEIPKAVVHEELCTGCGSASCARSRRSDADVRRQLQPHRRRHREELRLLQAVRAGVHQGRHRVRADTSSARSGCRS